MLQLSIIIVSLNYNEKFDKIKLTLISLVLNIVLCALVISLICKECCFKYERARSVQLINNRRRRKNE